ncbi:hypothetical protein EI94DRAFT_1773159 [Lactarius quietus]|nr:hypothetical protein EI94DRAFT_1773159 [Lactarius quietus]
MNLSFPPWCALWATAGPPRGGPPPPTGGPPPGGPPPGGPLPPPGGPLSRGRKGGNGLFSGDGTLLRLSRNSSDTYYDPGRYKEDDDTSSNSALISQYDIRLELRHRTWSPDLEEIPRFSQGARQTTPELSANSASGSELQQDAEEDTKFERVLEGLVNPTITKYLGGNIAKWAKLRGPSSTAFNEFIAIKGEVLVGDEVCEVFYRDIIQCIHALFADPELSPHLIFAPEWHYVDEDRGEQIYHDMHTGSWWWSTQVAVEWNMPGATIIPILVLSDKTQLTHFRNKSAYPIYMTISNILKEIRCKTSSQAYVLLGFLPTTKLELERNKAKWRRLTANLFHMCMHHILNPLISAGKNGVFMSTAEGIVHQNHPILACFIGDYPEQVLTTCSVSGDCPVCGTTRNHLGHFNPDDVPRPHKPDEFLEALDSFWGDSANFLQRCSAICMKPGLPHVNIYQSMTPDILHQLYQGVFKHLKLWVFDACDPAEIDVRCRRLPPNHNIRIFMKGISSLSRITGHEHDQMCQFFLGLLIDIHLPNNLSNVQLIWAVHAMLDFLYLAQYPIHTGSTLRLLTDTLTRFHANKDIFISLNICDQFNIPKFHAMIHFKYLITVFGTTDNFNTQYMERLHINLVKDAYATMNHKDEGEQMTTWNDCKECVHHHNQYVTSHMTGETPRHVDLVPPTLSPCRILMMAKHPSKYAVPLDRLQDTYRAPLFKVALHRFISATNSPNQSCQQLEDSLWGLFLPFTCLPFDPVTGKHSMVDAIHARLTRNGKHNQPIPGQFDTALINDGTGKGHGVKGYHFHASLFNPSVAVPLHLAYVQWYSPLTVQDPNHGMFKIRPQKDSDANWTCSIIPVGNIQRSVHLLPKFGPVVPKEWTSDSILDRCDTFFVNDLSNRQLFHTLYNYTIS